MGSPEGSTPLFSAAHGHSNSSLSELLAAESDAAFEETWQRKLQEHKQHAVAAELSELDLAQQRKQQAEEDDDKWLNSLAPEVKGRAPGWGYGVELQRSPSRDHQASTSTALGTFGSADLPLGSSTTAAESAAFSPGREASGAYAWQDEFGGSETTSIVSSSIYTGDRSADGGKASVHGEHDDGRLSLSEDSYTDDEWDGGKGGEGQPKVSGVTREQKLAWAAQLREIHTAHLKAHRVKLGAHALWKQAHANLAHQAQKLGGSTVAQDASLAGPPIHFVEKWVVRTGRRVIRSDVPPISWVSEWVATRCGQARDGDDEVVWRRELENALARRRRLEAHHQRMGADWYTKPEPRELPGVRREIRQLRASLRRAAIVPREDVEKILKQPSRVRQRVGVSRNVTAGTLERQIAGTRPARFGSDKQWDYLARELHAEFIREFAIAPGARRLHALMATRCGAQLQPRYPRREEDRDFHPWNNDPTQRGVRAPLHSIALHRNRGELRAFNKIPVSRAAPVARGLSSNAYGRGY